MPSDPPVQRLHPVSLVFSLGSAARRLLLPGLVVLFASRGSNTEIWLMVIFLPAAFVAVASYWSYRYRLGPDEMIVREGIVTRNERHIPYARVQNIDLVRNPLHRVFGVAEVHLQTASGSKPEAVIRVLSMPAIERLREHVFRGRDRQPAGEADAAATQGERPERLLEMPAREIVLFGLISNRGMAVVAALLGVLWQFDLWDFEAWAQRLPDEVVQGARSIPVPGLTVTVVVVAAALLAGLVLLRAFSVIWALFRFHGFLLERRGEDLRAEYGLLTRITQTIPRHRIQLISSSSRPLHRLCRRATVQVETAGGAKDEGSGVQRLWLAPLLRAERVPELIHEVLPGIETGDMQWRPIAPRARVRIIRKTIVLFVLLAAAAAFVAGPWSLLVLALGVPFAFVSAGLHMKHTCYALTPDAVAYRSGWWLRRMSVVRYGKIQSLTLAASPFDRRHGMASIQVDTAGAGRVGHRVAIRYLAEDVAREMMNLLADQAARTAFRW